MLSLIKVKEYLGTFGKNDWVHNAGIVTTGFSLVRGTAELAAPDVLTVAETPAGATKFLLDIISLTFSRLPSLVAALNKFLKFLLELKEILVSTFGTVAAEVAPYFGVFIGVVEVEAVEASSAPGSTPLVTEPEFAAAIIVDIKLAIAAITSGSV